MTVIDLDSPEGQELLAVMTRPWSVCVNGITVEVPKQRLTVVPNRKTRRSGK